MHPMMLGARARRNSGHLACARLSHRAPLAAGVLRAVARLVRVMQTVAAQSLVLDKRFRLPSVQGELDHLGSDVKGKCLFVAALGADSVEIIDLGARSDPGHPAARREPQRSRRARSHRAWRSNRAVRAALFNAVRGGALARWRAGRDWRLLHPLAHQRGIRGLT